MTDQHYQEVVAANPTMKVAAPKSRAPPKTAPTTMAAAAVAAGANNTTPPAIRPPRKRSPAKPKPKPSVAANNSIGAGEPKFTVARSWPTFSEMANPAFLTDWGDWDDGRLRVGEPVTTLVGDQGDKAMHRIHLRYINDQGIEGPLLLTSLYSCVSLPSDGIEVTGGTVSPKFGPIPIRKQMTVKYLSDAQSNADAQMAMLTTLVRIPKTIMAFIAKYCKDKFKAIDESMTLYIEQMEQGTGIAPIVQNLEPSDPEAFAYVRARLRCGGVNDADVYTSFFHVGADGSLITQAPIKPTDIRTPWLTEPVFLISDVFFMDIDPTRPPMAYLQYRVAQCGISHYTGENPKIPAFAEPVPMVGKRKRPEPVAPAAAAPQ